MPITPATKAEEVSNRPSLLEQSISLREYIDVSINAVQNAIRKADEDIRDLDGISKDRQEFVNKSSLERHAEASNALRSEIQNLDKRLEMTVKSALGPIHEKFIGYDKAISVLAARQDKEPFPSQVQSNMEHLKELTARDIAGLYQKISSIENLFVETKELNSKALDAAFRASSQVVDTQQTFNEKASNKMESGFTSQITEVKNQMALQVSGLGNQIDNTNKMLSEVSSKLTALESKALTTREVTSEKSSSTQFGIATMISIILGVVSIASFAMYVIFNLLAHHS